MVNEVEGLGINTVAARMQSIPQLPRQITKLRNGDLKRDWSAFKVVATTIAPIIERKESVRSIREQNRVDPATLLLIDGCCKDHVLEEDLWLRRRDSSLYDMLRNEEPCLVIAPDMSVYPDMPACHRLYQIKRTFLICAHLQRHGLTTVPFLAPHNTAHADNFAEWLRANPSITHVAASFQTVHRKAGVWERHFSLLRRIQKRVSRDLVWLLVGQGKHSRRGSPAVLGSVRFIVAGPKFDVLRRRVDHLQLPLLEPL